jgi:hypothetical protein
VNADRRAIVSIVGAVFVLLLVTVIIVVFGVIPLPEFPLLADQPDASIPGTVAYLDFDDDPCIFTVPASGGEPTEVWCGREYIEFPAWTADGLLVLTDWTTEPAYLLIDPATGAEVDRVPVEEQGNDRQLPALPMDERRERSDGAKVFTDGRNDDDEVEVFVRLATGDQETILSAADVPSDYYLYDAQWSPDGEWVLVADSAGRLLVVGADGIPGVRVLVDGLQDWGTQAAWFIPGDDTYTVDIPGR